MSEVETINIGGIKRNTTKMTVQNGDMEEIVNLRRKDGILQPLCSNTQIWTKLTEDIVSKYSQLIVHNGATYKHIIGIEAETLQVYFVGVVSDSGSVTVREDAIDMYVSQDKVQPHQVGNLLILNDTVEVKYLLWINGDDAYKVTSVNYNGETTDTDLIPLGNVQLRTKPKCNSDGVPMLYLAGGNITESGGKWNNLKGEKITTGLSMIAEARAMAKEKGILNGFVIGVVACELYDGTYTLCSQPMLLAQPNDEGSRYNDTIKLRVEVDEDDFTTVDDDGNPTAYANYDTGNRTKNYRNESSSDSALKAMDVYEPYYEWPDDDLDDLIKTIEKDDSVYPFVPLSHGGHDVGYTVKEGVTASSSATSLTFPMFGVDTNREDLNSDDVVVPKEYNHYPFRYYKPSTSTCWAYAEFKVPVRSSLVLQQPRVESELDDAGKNDWDHSVGMDCFNPPNCFSIMGAIPSESLAKYRLANSGRIGDKATAWGVVIGNGLQIKMDSAADASLAEIIKNVCVFISSEVYMSNENEDGISIPLFSYYGTSSDHNGRALGEHGACVYACPETNKSIRDDLLDTALFYKVYSTAYSGIESDTWKDIDMEDILNVLEEQETLNVDASTQRSGLSAACSYLYNGRLHLGNITETAFHGFPLGYFEIPEQWSLTAISRCWDVQWCVQSIDMDAGRTKKALKDAKIWYNTESSDDNYYVMYNGTLYRTFISSTYRAMFTYNKEKVLLKSIEIYPKFTYTITSDEDGVDGLIYRGTIALYLVSDASYVSCQFDSNLNTNSTPTFEDVVAIFGDEAFAADGYCDYIQVLLVDNFSSDEDEEEDDEEEDDDEDDDTMYGTGWFPEDESYPTKLYFPYPSGTWVCYLIFPMSYYDDYEKGSGNYITLTNNDITATSYTYNEVTYDFSDTDQYTEERISVNFTKSLWSNSDYSSYLSTAVDSGLGSTKTISEVRGSYWPTFDAGTQGYSEFDKDYAEYQSNIDDVPSHFKLPVCKQWEFTSLEDEGGLDDVTPIAYYVLTKLNVEGNIRIVGRIDTDLERLHYPLNPMLSYPDSRAEYMYVGCIIGAVSTAHNAVNRAIIVRETRYKLQPFAAVESAAYISVDLRPNKWWQADNDWHEDTTDEGDENGYDEYKTFYKTKYYYLDEQYDDDGNSLGWWDCNPDDDEDFEETDDNQIKYPCPFDVDFTYQQMTQSTKLITGIDTIDISEAYAEEARPNVLKVSSLETPMFFPADYTYQVGNATIRAICANTVALSTGQWGDAPLYVFCSDGVFGLFVDSSGEMVYSNARPISREVCNNALSVTPIDDAVVFSSERGLQLIAGSQVTEISQPIEGHYLKFTDDDSSDRLDSMATILSHSAWLDLADMPTEEEALTYLEDAQIGYNYDNKEIWVANPDKEYIYIYSEGLWSKAKHKIDYFINDYPSTYYVEDNTVYDIALDDESSTDTFFITRPIVISGEAAKTYTKAWLYGDLVVTDNPLTDDDGNTYYGYEETDDDGNTTAVEDIRYRHKAAVLVYGSADGDRYSLIGIGGSTGETRNIVAKVHRMALRYMRFVFVGRLEYASRIECFAIEYELSHGAYSTKPR